MTVMPKLPRAMLIDMDDTILSAYGRPEIAWNHVAAEFAGEFGPIPPQEVATAVLAFARNFWATAEAAWRLKLAEARDAPGQIADAKMRLGTALFHLGSADEADAALREAIALYQRNGNPHGEASARDVVHVGAEVAGGCALQPVAARHELGRVLQITAVGGKRVIAGASLGAHHFEEGLDARGGPHGLACPTGFAGAVPSAGAAFGLTFSTGMRTVISPSCGLTYQMSANIAA